MISKAVNESYNRSLEEDPSDEALASEYQPKAKSVRAAWKYLFLKRLAASAFKVGAPAVAAVLALFFLLSPLSSTVSANDSPFRRLFIENPQFNEFNFGLITDLPEAEKDFDELEIGYIPEGYELTNKYEDGVRRYYDYFFTDEQYIHISITSSKNASIRVDNEHTVHETLMVNGFMADLFYDETDRCGTIVLITDNYMMSISGCLTDKKAIIKVAENIK